jgi:hypothetical protein
LIDKQNGTFQLSCDICGEVNPKTFPDFYDAVEFKKENGWKSRKLHDQWHDVCPECLEEGN